jgi:Planctomycete cytochrome C
MFQRALCALLVIATSCASEERPETADYIIEAILVPKCGRAGCHSSETEQHGYAFDTIDNAIAAMTSTDRGRMLVSAGSAGDSDLYQVISGDREIMPPDSPLPTADIDLIAQWINDGAAGL